MAMFVRPGAERAVGTLPVRRTIRASVTSVASVAFGDGDFVRCDADL
jgi:hypothetical protein